MGRYIGISSFVLSILVLSIGTNVPELSIVFRAVLEKKKDIAFGNYIGSASLNTLEMGILTLIGKKTIPADGSNYSVTVFIIGLLFFIFFGKSKNTISRSEGLTLLVWYLIFVVCELITGPGWKL